MIHFTRYNFITGRILSVGSCEYLDVLMQAQTDEEHIFMGDRIDGELWYMPDGIKTPRPILAIGTEHTISANGVEAVQYGLPAGTQIESLPDGEMWPDEDELYFTSEVVGTFAFRLYLPFPYQGPVKVTIHAT